MVEAARAGLPSEKKERKKLQNKTIKKRGWEGVKRRRKRLTKYINEPNIEKL